MAAAALLGGCGGGGAAVPAVEPEPACEPPAPEDAPTVMSRATVETRRAGAQGLRLGLGLRDGSTTIVGFCTTAGDVPREIPALVAGGRRLEPVGGAYTQAGGQAFNYAYYPATTERQLDVLQAGEQLGTLRFGTTAAAPACPLHASGRFSVVACGALVVVEWHSPLRVEAHRLELIDAETWEGRERARQLGFFFLGAEPGQAGLVVRFGFRPPRGKSVSVSVSRVYLDRASGRIVERVLRPPVTTRFALRSAA